MQKTHTYDIIIPIFHPDSSFDRVLEMLKKQEPAPGKIILLETLGDGDTFVPYRGCEVVVVKDFDFDHASTRRLGVSYSSAEAFIMMTQDAMPKDTKLCARLMEGLYAWENIDRNVYVDAIQQNERVMEKIKTLSDGRIAMCYARQVPCAKCGEIERFSRAFNYPETSGTKSIADVHVLGIKAYFASDVCCAYNRELYESVMGYEPHAIFNEDMLYAAKAIRQGYRIAYRADACVEHSHNYSGFQQYHRNFDNGMSQAMYPEVFGGVAVTGEGVKLVKQTAAYLLGKGKFWLLPKLLWQSGMKYLGFKAGKNFRRYSYRTLRKKALNKAYIDRHFRNA